MGKISGSHCLVLGCRNRQLLNQTNTRSYFRFPRDAELCKKWVDFCSRPELYKKYDENGPEYLYKSSRICSDHFQPTDFNNPNLFSQGLKKGSIPTVNPATHETKTNNGTGAGGAPAGGGGGGGSGSSNGAGSPIDEKLLSAVASIPNLSANLSLMVAAAVHAAQQSQQQQQQLLLQANSGLNATNLKRSAAAMSGSGGSGALQLTTASGAAATTNSTTTTPSSGSSSAKRNRAVPPLATPTGALANLIQRHQQIKEQQIKEQQRKAALGGSGLVNGQVSITSVPGARTSPTLSSARGGGPISLVTSKKSAAANNNNNNVSHHNHNHKANHEQKHDQSDFGLNLNDTDMTGGESSEGDSSYQNSADEDYAYHQKQKVAKVEAVIPPSLKSQLTVTPATINNNTIHSTNGGGGALATSPTNGTINYKEKYEQTLKELFACRKIVKNQNKAIKQLQGEIDFLNQLLKEK
ncbi:mucin-21-like [Anopheles ziemanni]|uniref:mucin-21-like n=1 Tax=Anopheles coustani TaxID=139045 RepID=UPI0026588C88|nr:mucin-21-like [Anopheles coustani]XP_058126539.1 mucin-21-like [Anopheles coustani]XP_058126540.1 mucin-21-like [Anopheles coustani]XP_058173282.1 mucin-21-like [Anopheles ziemanni]